jgi:hypothetical protein
MNNVAVQIVRFVEGDFAFGWGANCWMHFGDGFDVRLVAYIFEQEELCRQDGRRRHRHASN